MEQADFFAEPVPVVTMPPPEETRRKRAPAPSNWVYPPAPWGRWDALLRCWQRHIESRVPEEDRRGAYQAVGLLRGLLDLAATPDNSGRPTAQREPGMEG